MANFNPMHAAHAIDEASIAVRLSVPCTPDQHKAVVKQAADIAKEISLPGRLPLDPINFMIRNQVTTGFGSAQGSGGTVFQRVAEDGALINELALDASTVIFRSRQYRRWAEIQESIQKALVPLVDAMCRAAGGAISVVELRCIDKFRAEGDAPSIESLLRRDTPLVLGRWPALSDQWHSHVGWFKPRSDHERMLVNVNVDVTDQVDEDETSWRTATILKLVAFQYSTEPDASGSSPPVDRLPALFDEAHQVEKELLGDLITDDLQTQIGLWSKEGGKRPKRKS